MTYTTYDLLNQIDSHFPIPSMVHEMDNTTFYMFRRYLAEKAVSVFEIDVPDWWPPEYVLYCAYFFGFLGVFDSTEYGVIPQFGTLSGFNVFYQPKRFLCANPAIHDTIDREIGVGCEIIKLTPDYRGTVDLLNYYAALLTACAQTTATNISNSMLSYVFTARNKSTAESFKLLFDKIRRGEPAVVQDAQLLDKQGNVAWQTFAQNLGQNYIANNVLVTMRKIENMFDTDFGIPNANTDKMEHLTQDEINANNNQTFCKAMLWYDSLKRSFDRVNKKYGLSLAIRWRVPPAITGDGIKTAGVPSMDETTTEASGNGGKIE